MVRWIMIEGVKVAETDCFHGFFLSFCVDALLVKPAASQAALPTVIIQPDGSVSPAIAPIQRNGNIYTFTNNIYAAIKILKSNAVLDGAGHTLSGAFSGNSTDIG